MKKLFFSGVALMVLLAANTFAGVPQMINYQGQLTDDQGDPVTATVTMDFTIYDDSTGGNPLWSETQASVAVKGGLFNS